MKNTSEPAAPDSRDMGRITLAVGAIMILYALVFVELIGIGHSWNDEVAFVDPAANLYFHGKFVTTAWPYQTVSEVFFGNAPLFSLLLAGWFHLVGFGLFQARLLPGVLAYIGIALSLVAINRHRILPLDYTPWLVCLFLTGYGLTVSIWSVRYDTLGFALVAMVLYGLTAPDRAFARYTKLAALFIIPAAGFHLVFVIAFLYALIVRTNRRVLRSAATDMACMIAGGLAMLIYYGVEVGFRRFVFLTVFSAHTVFGQAARGLSSNFAGFALDKSEGLLKIFYQDASYLVILLAVLVLLLRSWKNSDRVMVDPMQRELTLGAMALPMVLYGIGKYPAYYSWIGWSCLCVLFFMLVASAQQWTRRSKFAICAIACAASAFVGVGRYLYDDLHSAPSPQEVLRLTAAIEKEASNGEVFYADDSAYFNAWTRARYVYTSSYAQNHFLPGYPTIAPVTTIVVRSRDVPKVTKLVGGRWVCTWQASAAFEAGGATLRICKRL